MRIGIDISQIVHEGTGVGRYVREMVTHILAEDQENEYVLFGASLRKRHVFYEYFSRVRNTHAHVELVVVTMPPSLLDLLWNILHIIPIERFIGAVDVFWSSDWVQPPLARAVGMTTIHDLTVLKYPESFAQKIVRVHTRRLKRVVATCDIILCDSLATRDDVQVALAIDEAKLHVVYPGFTREERV